ncbi:MAG: hypothetical protein ACI909_003252, partial [Planctomycetota bacterium]
NDGGWIPAKSLRERRGLDSRQKPVGMTEVGFPPKACGNDRGWIPAKSLWE